MLCAATIVVYSILTYFIYMWQENKTKILTCYSFCFARYCAYIVVQCKTHCHFIYFISYWFLFYCDYPWQAPPPPPYTCTQIIHITQVLLSI